MDLVEAAVWVLGHSEGANAVKDAASRYLIEAFDSGWPGPRPTEHRLAFHVGEPDKPELQPHQEGYVKPEKPGEAYSNAGPEDVKPLTEEDHIRALELWSVVALVDGTFGLWHPQEQGVLREPRNGLPKGIAEARRDRLNQELRDIAAAAAGTLTHVSPENIRLPLFPSGPKSTPPPPTHASGLVHHYADEAEAMRLATESQERLRNPR